MITVGMVMDVHGPYEDVKAYNLMMEVFADNKLSALYLIGDFADMYWVHGHGPKHPLTPKKFSEEIEWVNRRLDEIDKQWKSIPKHFIEGNHEWRLERYLIDKCPELFGFIDCEQLFKLRERPGWRWHPYGPNQLVQVAGSKLYAKHDPGPGANSEAIAKNLGCNLVYGHCHRIRRGHHVTANGQDHMAYSAGWVGNKKFDRVFGYVKGHHLWQLGFSMITVDPKTKYFYADTVQILDNYTCYYNGKRYKA